MLGCSGSLFGLSSSDPLKDTFLLYKKVTEQYGNPEILRIIRSLIPQDIVLQTSTKDDGWNIVPLLIWFKNDFMKWTPKDPVCEMCVDRSDDQSNLIEGCSNDRSVSAAAAPIMSVKKNNRKLMEDAQIRTLYL